MSINLPHTRCSLLAARCSHFLPPFWPTRQQNRQNEVDVRWWVVDCGVLGGAGCFGCFGALGCWQGARGGCQVFGIRVSMSLDAFCRGFRSLVTLFPLNFALLSQLAKQPGNCYLADCAVSALNVCDLTPPPIPNPKPRI